MLDDVPCGDPKPKRREQKADETEQIDRAARPNSADEYAREPAESSFSNRAAERCTAQEQPTDDGGEEGSGDRTEPRAEAEGPGQTTDVRIGNMPSQIKEHSDATEERTEGTAKRTQTKGDREHTSRRCFHCEELCRRLTRSSTAGGRPAKRSTAEHK